MEKFDYTKVSKTNEGFNNSQNKPFNPNYKGNKNFNNNYSKPFHNHKNNFNKYQGGHGQGQGQGNFYNNQHIQNRQVI